MNCTPISAGVKRGVVQGLHYWGQGVVIPEAVLEQLHKLLPEVHQRATVMKSVG